MGGTIDRRDPIGAARRTLRRLYERRSGRRFRVKTNDRFGLHTRVHEVAGSRACLVLCHGITADSREGGLFTSFARAANDRGLSVVRFDFRGHGRSAGGDRDFTLAGQRRDLAAILALVRHLELGPPLLLGMSFGTAPVVIETTARDYPGLVLWSPVVDYERTCLEESSPWARGLLAGRGAPGLPNWAFAEAPGGEFTFSKALAAECEIDRTPDRLRELRKPILVFSGTDDEVVPTEPTAEAAAANPSIDYRPIQGEIHSLTGSRPRVIAETLDWVEGLRD